MKQRLLIIAPFVLVVIIWYNILNGLFSGSLGDLFGLGILFLIAVGLGMLFIYLKQSIKNIVAKVILYVCLLCSLLLIQPLFHFSTPQPYEALYLTRSHLKQYNTISYGNVYTDHDQVLKAIALYKFQSVLPEKGFLVSFSIPQPTDECPGCSDDYRFLVECNGLNCTSTADQISISTRSDSVVFEGYYKAQPYSFYYHNDEIKPFLDMDQKHRITSFELNKNLSHGYFGQLKKYLIKNNFEQVDRKEETSLEEEN